MQPTFLSNRQYTNLLVGIIKNSRERLIAYLDTYPFWIRLRHWEYWPFQVIYLPVFFYYLWLSLRARSFFFFSASNPGIESGGLLGESKWRILQGIAPDYLPRTMLTEPGLPLDQLLLPIRQWGLSFPMIAKPDVGERGWRVEKILSAEQLQTYNQQAKGRFLIQEYIDMPLELGIFYYRMPGQNTGRISSVVQKEFLTVTGNGRATLAELIHQQPRALLQRDVLYQQYGSRWQEVLAAGESLQLVSIGNHCRGTTFLDANALITPALEQVFDRISLPIPGFYYGRYDLRCSSLTDLYAGRNIRILELNGAGAEPAHIYQPGFSLREAYRVLLLHWQQLYCISHENHRRGIPYMGWREALSLWRTTQQLHKGL